MFSVPVCASQEAFSIDILLSLLSGEVFQKLPVLQSSLLPHYSELLMC